jgi:hypothetical protein
LVLEVLVLVAVATGWSSCRSLFGTSVLGAERVANARRGRRLGFGP